MISNLFSDRKILFYVTNLSHKFISCHIADLLVSKGHLADDLFSHVVLTWPWFWVFHAFTFCISLEEIYWGALTTKGASLVWMNCCQCSGFCRGDHRLVHWEVGDGVFALIVQANVIWSWTRVHIPRPCWSIGGHSWGGLPSLLLSLGLFHLDQGMNPVIKIVWVNKLDLGNLHKFHQTLFYSIPSYLD